MVKTDIEGLWLLAVVSKCASHSLLNTIILALLFLLSCLILHLIFWAHPGGPAWGKHKWTKPKSSPSTRAIPGPKGLPIIGSMDLMSGLAHHKIAAAAQAFRAQRLIAFSLGETRVVVTCNPDVAKEILNSSTFSDRPAKESAYGLMFNRSIGFAPYGVYWAALRRIAAAHLFCPKQIKASEQQRLEIANQVVEVLTASSDRTADPIRVRDVLKLASLNNMMCSVFGRRYDVGSVNPEIEELRDLVDQGYDLLGRLNWSDHLSFLADFDFQKIRLRCGGIVPRVNRLVGGIITEHKMARGGGGGEEIGRDFVDVLLSLSTSDRLSDSDMIAVLWMADPTRPEFDILDSEGLEYHRWVSDVETTFVAKDYSATIFGTTGDEPSDKTKASALMFLRRHIDPSLRWEYLQLKSPKELWDALKGRFGNIHNTLLPELTVQWNEIRLLDYKRVNDFNKDMLRLKARLNFCGKEITEDDMIQKTLSTFPTSALILANQYRLEYDNNRITTFNKLINLLQVAERHNEVLVNNNARPAGTKKIPEANYGKVKSGKKPNAQRTDHGNSNPQRGKRFSGRGRGRGRGGSSNVMRRLGAPGSSSQGNHKAPTPHVAPKVRTGDEPCYRCGDAGHWYKNCHASKQVTALYKKYRESKERETHYMEEDMLDESPDVNFTVTDNRNELYVPQSLEAPLYD
ncbi:hypothetical protein OROGR_030163 [Orobanche gracilis]